MFTVRLTLMLSLLGSTAIAQAPAQIGDRWPTAPVAACSVVLHKPPHDGDTLTDATIELPFRINLAHVSIRAYDMDTWEISRTRQTVRVTDEEIQKGIAARDALIKLIANNGNRLYVEDTGLRDPYGRLLGKLWVQTNTPKPNWVYVPKYMTEHGHCRSEIPEPPAASGIILVPVP